MKIYIAGMIIGNGKLSLDQIAANCDLFDETAARLRVQGHQVINPIELHEPHPTKLTTITPELVQHRIRINLIELLNCDAIFMLKNWRESPGATLEYTVAAKSGLKIMGAT